MKYSTILVWAVAACVAPLAFSQTPTDFGVKTSELLYESAMDSRLSVKGWTMEGPGRVEFADGWMTMASPSEKMHHVFWCPKTLPDSFVAQWEMQNLHLEAGLCIVFFAATGLSGEDVMDPSLPKRDGTFSQYNNQALKNYHISYYTNNPKKPDRPMARLRKNPGKKNVSEGPRGIEVSSSKIHKVTLIKEGTRIRLYVDKRPIIDWTDDGKVKGKALGAGKIALRQMRWTRFRYRNFTVWGLEQSLALGMDKEQAIRFEVQQITTGPKHHLFGYIGHALTIPWNKSGRYIVSMRTDFFKRMPKAGEPCDIVIIDTKNDYAVTKVDESLAWNLQKGTMLYWNPNAPETQFFFNDRDPKTEDIFTVLYDISTMKRVKEYRFGPGPSTVANTGVAPNGRFFVAVNHGRNNGREVVSYAGAIDETLSKPANPSTDGLFKVDIATGKRTLIISYAAIVKSLAPLGYVVDPSYPLTINRTTCNRDSNRINFVIRGNNGGPNNRKNKWPQVEFIIRSDGTNLIQAPKLGHTDWIEGPLITRGNKKGWIDLYNVDTASFTGDKIGTKNTFKDPGADMAYSPDGRWMVCSYESEGSWGYQFYRFSDGAVFTATTTLTRRGATPINSSTRIDGAPRWNRTSDAILVGGIVTENNSSKDTRQMAIIRLIPDPQ